MTYNYIIAHAIINFVCQAYGLKPFEIKIPNRGTQAISDARHTCISLIRKYCHGMSIYAIGELLGRDHSTVVCSVKKTEKLVEGDQVFRYQYNLCLLCVQKFAA